MPYDSTRVWNLKYNTIELICEIETYSQTQKMNLWLPKRKEGGGGINKEFGISRYKLLHIKQINSKVQLYSTGNYIQYPVIKHYGKEYEYIYLCIHIYIYI